ncbi:MAG: lytic transglycosylase domain-containing protein [Candidatus Brocadiae bacterium]|nr:lytic transglycosylase domain-containing protein [Candidatus Brocadiia bacterium]
MKFALKKAKWGMVFVLFFLSGFLVGDLYKPKITKEIVNIIEQEAKNFALDPLLVQAIVLIESSGWEKAISVKGAKGMMQLMPETANQLAKELNISLVSDSLLDPKINIRLGCYYIHQLVRKFQGDMVAVLAGYNTGPFRVSQWLSEHQESSTFEIIEAKASPQTRIFVRRVLAYYKKLQRLYSE